MTPSELRKAAEYVLSDGASEDYVEGMCVDPDDCSVCDEHRRKMREYPKMLAAAYLHASDPSFLFGLPIYDEQGKRITKDELMK